MAETCALCEKRAAMLCASDQAKLCWNCDEKVHSANFLVANHSRVLLCCSCHSPTPWKASGAKLTPTVTFCQSCVGDGDARLQPLLNNVQQHGYCMNPNNDHGEERENHPLPIMSAASATSPPTSVILPCKLLRTHSFSMDSHAETACSSSVNAAALATRDDSTFMTVSKVNGVGLSVQRSNSS